MNDLLKSYSEELKILIQKSHDSFEKQLNYISAGALGLSMLLIEKIVKDIQLTRCNWLLILSWTFFSLTLISNLVSHIYTSNVHDKTLKEIYNEEYKFESAIKRNKTIKCWNIISISLLFSGIIFQLIFIALNI